MVNVMDEYISYNEKCFHRYFKLIFEQLYDKDIASKFIDTYINVRYSNYLDESNQRVALGKKISKALEDTYKEVLSEVKMTKENGDMVNACKVFSNYLFNLDQLYLLESQKKSIEEIADKRLTLLKKYKDDEFFDEFNRMIRDDIKKKKEFLQAFESKVFSLEYDAITKDLFYAKLKSDIAFPELYSDTAIRKAQERDSVAEDLTSIAFLQVSVRIANDLIACDFDNEYIVDLPKSYFDKKTKIKGLFNIIDNTYVQDRLRIAVDFATFTRYRSYIMEYMRNGFVFAIKLDESFDYSSENIEYLEIFDKILIDSNKYYYKDMKKSGRIKDRIITVDEVK